MGWCGSRAKNTWLNAALTFAVVALFVLIAFMLYGGATGIADGRYYAGFVDATCAAANATVDVDGRGCAFVDTVAAPRSGRTLSDPVPVRLVPVRVHFPFANSPAFCAAIAAEFTAGAPQQFCVVRPATDPRTGRHAAVRGRGDTISAISAFSVFLVVVAGFAMAALLTLVWYAVAACARDVIASRRAGGGFHPLAGRPAPIELTCGTQIPPKRGSPLRG